jgi:serine/threonine protein kinase/WD40 repeat protein
VSKSSPPSQNKQFSLSPDERLGHFAIVGPLGLGGQGEVYRAHDTRLGRDVAIKILRGPVDQKHLEMLRHEARTVAALNHPNIVSVYDVVTDAEVPYVVTELLEGETLRARLDRARLPFRRAIDYGIQMAQALDAAHSRGIWHRDVKPGNAFVTSDDRVKLLDFGLAKLTERAPETTSQETTREPTHRLEICGTAGYMSPEQVLGRPVDHRTDIFALGAVLYEAFTGRRAFDKPSSVQTMNAVLEDDPPDPVTLNAQLPAAAATIVRRCLEKDREHRFQSARDLAFALQQVRDASSTLVPPAPPVRFSKALAILATTALIAVVALATFAVLQSHAHATFEQLTFSRARIGGARFASDGQAVVFSETREGNTTEVSRLDLADSPQSQRLSYPNGGDVLAARPGELALVMRRRFLLGERFVGTLARAPVAGGTPHEMMENVEDADWAPGGDDIAIVRSTGDAGGQSWLEYAGRTIYKSTGSIRFVRTSRDGRRVAFLEDRTGRASSGGVVVVDLSGSVTRLTDDFPSVRGLAWSPAGDELWFAAGTADANRSLRGVTLQGAQRLLLEAPGSLTLWDVSNDGRALVTRDDERRSIVGVPPGETVERELSWYGNSAISDLSPDGRWLLFGDRFGIYLRGTDGAPPIHLGLKDGFADQLSPDGKTVLATTQSLDRLVLVPTAAGEARFLPSHGIVSYSGAQWFPDGKRVLFNGRAQGHNMRSYVQDIDGGEPRPVTPEDTRALSISPDGRWAAAIGAGQAISVWPMEGGASRVVPGSEPGDRPMEWSADGRALWLFRRGEVPAHVHRLDIETGKRELWKTLVPPDAAGVYSIIEFRVTPTGHSYFYSYTRLLSQLYLVRGLR